MANEKLDGVELEDAITARRVSLLAASRTAHKGRTFLKVVDSTSFTKQTDRFCIMGLCCEVFRQKTGEGLWVSGVDGCAHLYSFVLGNHISRINPPYEVIGFFGLRSDLATTLTELNDLTPRDWVLKVYTLAELAEMILSSPIVATLHSSKGI